jgi:large subunit ribosomal protein L12e
MILVKHNGNITFNDILNVARAMKDRSMAKKLSGTVKEVLGTAQSVGCTIDGKAPHDLIDAINDGELEIPDS